MPIVKKMRKECAGMLLFMLIQGIISSPAQAQDKKELSASDIALIKEISSLRNDLSEARTVRMENLTMENQTKAAWIIEELLNRAEQKVCGTLKPLSKKEFDWGTYESSEAMIAQAKEFIKTLKEEKDPFEGKFAEPGGYVVDHAFVKKGGEYHVFYIRGIAATDWPAYHLCNFGHAVSKDLKNWKIEKPVLQCPESGCDQFQVWAPHILKRKGLYYMFYVGVNPNVCQSICLATSKDLYNWKRDKKNPVIISGSWADGIYDQNKWSDCRDPMVLKDGRNYYCYFTAMGMNPETHQQEQCIGISSSRNLLNWKDEGFIRLEQSLNIPPESPFVVKRNGTYYLVYTNYKHGIVYLTSNDPVKGWQEMPEDKMSILSGVSATELLKVGSQWQISLISHLKNGLHFLEFRQLIWNKDGSLDVKPLDR